MFAADTARAPSGLRGSALVRTFAHFAESSVALASLGVLVLLVAVAMLAPWIAPQNPFNLAELSLWDSRLPPWSTGAQGAFYLLGTDDQGRDMLSAIMYGLRISLGVAISATFVAVILGAVLGALAAFAGGWVDAAVMRVADFQLAFPAVLIALALLALLGSGVDKVILALILVQWAYYARTVRSAALVERRKEYIEAAVSLGLGSWRILWRHLLPNCLSPLIVVAMIEVGSAIALEATLSFLGLGTPITQPSLGLLIANGYSYMLSGNYWISFFPGIALFALIISINLCGDRLRDILNPWSRQ
jgi:peptide/nickel transport system permease protein